VQIKGDAFAFQALYFIGVNGQRSVVIVRSRCWLMQMIGWVSAFDFLQFLDPCFIDHELSFCPFAIQ
jgi:hypothetical protein